MTYRPRIISSVPSAILIHINSATLTSRENTTMHSQKPQSFYHFLVSLFSLISPTHQSIVLSSPKYKRSAIKGHLSRLKRFDGRVAGPIAAINEDCPGKWNIH